MAVDLLEAPSKKVIPGSDTRRMVDAVSNLEQENPARTAVKVAISNSRSITHSRVRNQINGEQASHPSFKRRRRKNPNAQSLLEFCLSQQKGRRSSNGELRGGIGDQPGKAKKYYKSGTTPLFNEEMAIQLKQSAEDRERKERERIEEIDRITDELILQLDQAFVDEDWPTWREDWNVLDETEEDPHYQRMAQLGFE